MTLVVSGLSFVSTLLKIFGISLDHVDKASLIMLTQISITGASILPSIVLSDSQEFNPEN